MQPRGTVTLTEDSVHTLFVGVQSDLPEGVALAYQWSKDGVDIPGATKPLLWLDPVTRARAGKYAVRVSSDWGTLVSEPAVVQVAPGTGPRGELALRPELKRFEWRFNPAPGRQFTPEDAAGLQLEVSDDLKAWTRVPGGVLIENGVLVFREDQSEFKARRFYRLAAIASLPPPAAQTDPAAQISLADVPQAVRALAQEHIQAFIGDARSRTAEERNWENVTFADEARLLFDPGHAQGGEPTYVELRVVSALNPRRRPRLRRAGAHRRRFPHRRVRHPRPDQDRPFAATGRAGRCETVPALHPGLPRRRGPGWATTRVVGHHAAARRG
ncbi:MAG: hypothetical protein M5U12_05615 [Verrucomicrobia bacterium]|nr:hypothetical protein [Verrucomicrobiota bacterium]